MNDQLATVALAQQKAEKDIAYRQDEIAALNKDLERYRGELDLMRKHVAALEKPDCTSCSRGPFAAEARKPPAKNSCLVAGRSLRPIVGSAPSDQRRPISSSSRRLWICGHPVPQPVENYIGVSTRCWGERRGSARPAQAKRRSLFEPAVLAGVRAGQRGRRSC